MYFLQFEILLVTTVAALVYLVAFKPYNSRYLNLVDSSSEAAHLLTVYIASCFASVGNERLSFNIGWVYITVVCLTFTIELVLVVSKIGKKVYETVKNMRKQLTDTKSARMQLRQKQRQRSAQSFN